MITQAECWARHCRFLWGCESPEVGEFHYCQAYQDGIPADIVLGQDIHLKVRNDQKNLWKGEVRMETENLYRKLRAGEEVYIENVMDDVAFRLYVEEGTIKVEAKRSGKKWSVKLSAGIVCEARTGGRELTKQEWDNY